MHSDELVWNLPLNVPRWHFDVLFVDVIKCIKSWITPGFPKTGLMEELEGLIELIKANNSIIKMYNKNKLFTFQLNLLCHVGLTETSLCIPALRE